MRKPLLFFLVVAFSWLSLWNRTVQAYVLEGQKWPNGNIVMYLELGSSGGTLIDGNTAWGPVVENALADWNQYLKNVQFAWVENATIQPVNGDGKNVMYWNSSYFGQSFGSSTLAVTSRIWNSLTNVTTDADVTFNNTKSWNSYRGNLKYDSSGQPINDLRRVALHELGHVLGLNHPDLSGQTVTAQMNSVESNLDDLAQDDISGGQALYGAPVTVNYTIGVSASPAAGGTVSGGGTFTANSSQTVSASANGGYTFTNWTENGTQVSTQTSYTFTLTTNRNLVANFASGLARMSTPTPGGTLASSTVPFTWVAGNGATAYWLYVGSTVGGSDYFNSNSLATSVLTQTVSGLPTNGSAVYVRLYSMVGGTWYFNDYTYTASTVVAETVSTPTVPSGTTSGSAGTAYTYSTGGSTSNRGNSVQYLFNWGDGTNSGWLAVGTTSASKSWSAGSYTVTAQARSAANTAVVSSLSPGLTVTMASTSLAHMVSPVNGTVFSSTTVPFTWAAGNGATAYWLYVGSTVGGSNYFSSGSLATSVLSQTVSGLPTNGTTVYVRLYSMIGGTWYSNDYTYTAMTVVAETVSTPTVPSGTASGAAGTTYTYGTGGATSNLGNSVQYLFNWGDGTNSGWLAAGTTSASKSWSAGTYSMTAQARSAANTAVVSSISPALTVTMGSTSPAHMVSPANGAVFSSGTVAFTWAAGTGATAYWLYVGSTVGGSDYFNSNSLATSVLTQTVSGLPTDGSAVYVRLWTSIGGAWSSNDYTYTASTVVETVSTPTKPTGTAGGTAGTTYAYSTGGSTSNLGNAVQYLLNWGDGTNSGWLPVGTTSASKSWSAGTYVLTAQARSATNTAVISSVSTGLTVTIAPVTTGPAQMLAPVPGGTFPPASVPFTWSAGGGATGYALYVGNTAGGSDLYNSGVLAANILSQTVTGLPTDGRMIFVRLWSQVAGVWTYTDYSYTAFMTIGATKAQMMAPVGGTTLPGASVPFNWSVGNGSTGYGLFVGSTSGASDLYNSGILPTNILTEMVNGLPTDGRTLYVRLWTQLAGNWVFTDYTYTAFTSAATSKAQMMAPPPGIFLNSALVPFTWNAGNGATGYGLFVGSTSGASDLYNSGILASTVLTQTVNGLPTDGRTLYVRLWTQLGAWVYNDYTYIAGSPETVSTPTPPAGPTSGIAGTSYAFSTGGSTSSLGNAVQYRLDWGDGTNTGWLAVGTTSASKSWAPGTYGVTAQARSATNTAVVSLLSPPGAPVVIAPVTTGPPQLVAPPPGVALIGTTVLFGWNPPGTGSAPTGYGLFVATTPGGSDLYNSGILASSVLTQTVTGLPSDGRNIFVRLWWQVSGNWLYADYSYTAYLAAGTTKAQMMTPAGGATLSGASVPFNWSAGNGSTGYGLFVGSTPGGSDLYNSGILTNNILTQTVNGLPTDGRALYVRLWSQLSGNWVFNDYVYTAFTASGSSKAQMATPANGSTLPGATATFTWTAGSGATNYGLFVGTTQGGSELYNSGVLANSALSQTVGGLPTNFSTVYVRLWSEIGGVWVYNDYSYKAF